jgi:hypothetical protein
MTRAAVAAIASLVVLGVLVVALGDRPALHDRPAPNGVSMPTVATGTDDLVVIVAGDIACAPGVGPTPTSCHQADTAALLERSGLAARAEAALLLGDIQYEAGRVAEFASFRDSWGRVLDEAGVPVYPTPGNHEWYDPDPAPPGCRLADAQANACGYESFFGKRAFTGDVADGDGNRGYRLEATDGTHPLVVVLIDAGRCEHDAAACSASSPAAAFLRSALADPRFNSPDACVVVGWHQARWSGHGHGDLEMVDGLWRALFAGPLAQRPDLVVNGHDHLYERFPPLGVEGRPSDDGITEIVAGAGGREIGIPVAASSPHRPVVQDTEHFGVLALVQDPVAGSITTSFVTDAGARDRSTVACRT